MVRFIKKTSKKAGLSPGTLVHVGDIKAEYVRIRVADYGEDYYEEKEITNIEECLPYKKKSTVTWINIDGLHDVDIIEKIGKDFGLHPLVMEDIAHTEQRPKMDEFEDYVFIITQMLLFDEEQNRLKAEQFSVVLGENFVISFQENISDRFDPLRERIRRGKGRIRKMGADYLMYAMIDAIVDDYFIVLEKIGEKVEELDEELVSRPGPELLQKIHNFKRELIFLRKAVWPLRETVSTLERGGSAFIQEKTSVFLKDVYDHTIQVIDTAETLRDIVTGMLDVYISSVSNRLNEVMKLLTVIATIFIPLTFIAGVYGMNFKYMPELEYAWGYPAALFFMLVVGVLMLLWFKSKKFL
ncbi:Magnesium transport protein CorA [uncultured Desulfobacterium sp.]|uniref:Magnesium transport protein CorA n=1 Tax=uncultured Desulfobacterium sp. TaxID=201089 RepID=A0A445N006_9BACT|nr:Magnesium transport protein CorA [uncultured Desulfobacterium sp.]